MITEEEKTDHNSSDQFAKEGTNGCFGNIFAKKLTALQLSNGHTASDAVLGHQKVPGCNKAATWEKSSERSSRRKHIGSVDFHDPTQCKTTSQPPTSADRVVSMKGVMLQDCVILNGSDDQEANPDESDGVSLASSQSLSDVKRGERSCSLSASEGFRGSTLSCDIVTYL